MPDSPACPSALVLAWQRLIGECGGRQRRCPDGCWWPARRGSRQHGEMAVKVLRRARPDRPDRPAAEAEQPRENARSGEEVHRPLTPLRYARLPRPMSATLPETYAGAAAPRGHRNQPPQFSFRISLPALFDSSLGWGTHTDDWCSSSAGLISNFDDATENDSVVTKVNSPISTH